MSEKSGLVIDTPKSCSVCVLAYHFTQKKTDKACIRCFPKRYAVDSCIDSRPDFCPLQPVSEALNVNPPPPKTPINTRSGQEPAFLASLDLRDYFAGQYLAGRVARGGNPVRAVDLAKDAYIIADAMLKERPSGGAS